MISAILAARCVGQPAATPKTQARCPPRLLERQPVAVERLREPDVVEQRRDVEQFVVEGDPVGCAVHRSPQVGADGVVEQRGRAETGGHGQRGRSSRSLRKHVLSFHMTMRRSVNPPQER
jgi:hypothetical protein